MHRTIERCSYGPASRRLESRRTLKSVVLFCSALGLFGLTGGCSNDSKWSLVPVRGIVCREGRPLAEVKVIFLADVDSGTQGPRSSAVTDARGCYELRTDAGGKGAAPGNYRVCVVGHPTKEQISKRARRVAQSGRSTERFKEVLADSDESSTAADAVVIPQKYAQFSKTPLRAEVKAGSGQKIDFNIP